MSILPDVIAANTGAVRPVLRDPRAVGMFVFGVVVGAVSMAPEYSRARSPDPAVVTARQDSPVRGTDIVIPPSRDSMTLATSPQSAPPRTSAPARVESPGHRGSLVVRSTPAGATVFINNKPAGRTPLVVRSMPIGSRAVRLTLNGHTTWSRGVQVVAGQSTTVVAKLDRQ